jgi:hypothetical protein
VTVPGPDWVEQARRFAAALAAEDAGGAGLTDLLSGLSGQPAEGDTAGQADHGAECRWCPLCAGLAALRGRRPDLLEALADVLASAATALRTTAGTTPGGSAAQPGAPAPEPTVAPEETVPHPAPTVQRIEVA